MWWPIGVCAIEDGDEVCFECLNGSFSQVLTVHACVDTLAVKVLRFDICNQVIGDFIVKSMEDWLDSCINEVLVACIIALNQVICTPALDWFCWDCIGVMIIECEDTAVALVASPGKHAW